jgi:hypothetical protein
MLSVGLQGGRFALPTTPKYTQLPLHFWFSSFLGAFKISYAEGLQKSQHTLYKSPLHSILWNGA